MKILKYVLGAIAVLFGLFLLYGVMNPTVEYGNEIEVNKPLNESWAVFMDESKMKEWLPFIKSQELVSGEKGKVGAVTKMQTDMDGREMEMMETITALKENEHMGMQFEGGGMMQNLDMHFSEKDGKTIIKSSSVAKGSNIFNRAMFAMMKGMFKENDMTVMNALKTTIENNTTDYFPEPVLISEDAVMEAADATTEEGN